MVRPTAGRRLAVAAGAALWVTLAAGVAWADEGSLRLLPEPQLLVTLLVLFALLIVPVDRLLFRPVFRVLDERAAKIEGTRARAARIEREAEQTLERYERAVRDTREQAEQERRGRLDEARGELQRTTAAARGEAEAEIERARHGLEASYQAARQALRAQAQELARQAASRVLGRPL
jgi:F-type H+-transporting ATPase subunit b